MTSNASGQPFDIVGGIDTNSDNSNIMNGTQSCTYYLNEYVCRPQKDRPPVCGFESVPHTGTSDHSFEINSIYDSLAKNDMFQNETCGQILLEYTL
ncbi:MAG: hypothetical protein ACK5P5_07795 [Pseudobdellovibrionaceae bacterium]